MKTKKIILITLITIGSFTSCSKVADAVLEEATPLSSSDFVTEAKIDNTIDDVSNLVQEQYGAQATEKMTGKSTVSITGPTTSWSINTTTNTVTRTVDYGTTGYTLSNGNIVTGKIIMTFLKDFIFTTGVAKTITYSLVNFTHNGNTITGSKSLTIT